MYGDEYDEDYEAAVEKMKTQLLDELRENQRKLSKLKIKSGILGADILQQIKKIGELK